MPAGNISNLRYPLFSVSDATHANCVLQSAPALHSWRGLGHDIDVPKLLVQMPGAIAHLLAHGTLRFFELSLSRRVGLGIPYSEQLLRLCSEFRQHGAEPEAEVQTVLEPNKHAACGVFLHSLLPLIDAAGLSVDERSDMMQECGMRSHWLVQVQTKKYIFQMSRLQQF